MEKIGVLTSGGDSPGMNAAVRAVTLAGVRAGVDVVGILHGYQGIIDGEFRPLDEHEVRSIGHLGGTILRSSRCRDFYEEAGRARAAASLREAGIEGLVTIGGDGTYRGAKLLGEEHGIAAIGVPGTIDNDIFGTDSTLGFDTAVNTALDAIDRIRDTAESHERCFFVEVMGRDAGHLALAVAAASGAEGCFIPETDSAEDFDEIVAAIGRMRTRGRTSLVVVVAEGDEAGGAIDIAREVASRAQVEQRTCILGHIQRGGAPTARDRILGGTLGRAAVLGLLSGKSGVMVGERKGEVAYTPLEAAWEKRKEIHPDILALADLRSV